MNLKDYKKLPGIYIFTNKINGKQYVGESMNIYKRMEDYKNTIRPRPIIHALRKYSFDNFHIHIEYLPDYNKKILLDIEECLIKKFDCIAPNGYNICNRGNDTTGVKPSIEARKKMSEIQKGKKLSLETRKKIGEFHKGNKYNLGKKHSLEHSRKIGKANSKSVLQFSKDNIFIKQFDSMIDASIKLNIHNSSISEVCNNKRKTAGGFIWRYAE